MSKSKVCFIVNAFTVFLIAVGLSVLVGFVLATHLHKDSMEAEIDIETSQENDSQCTCDEECDHTICDSDCDCEEHTAQPFLASGTYYKNGSSFYTRVTSRTSTSTKWRCTVCGAEGWGLTCYHDVQVSNGTHNWSASAYGSHSCSASAYGGHSTVWVSCSACGGKGYKYEDGLGWLHEGERWTGCTSCGGSGEKYSAYVGSYDDGYVAGHGGWTKCSYCGQTSYNTMTGTCYSHVTQYKCSYCQSTFTTNSTAQCTSRVTQYKCSKCGNTSSSNASGTCYKTQNQDCATTVVSTSTTYYYKYTNIDTGVTGSETTSSYSVATGFNVKFNINNANAVNTTGTTGGSMSNQYMLHGHSEALTANAFTFSGHRFAGWSTTAGTSSSPASVTYTNGQSINLSTSNVSSGGTYNLYAVWLYEVPQPTLATSSYQFTNAPISVQVNNYDSTTMTQGGTTSATARGSYTVTYTLKSGYCWSGGSTSVVSLNWSITVRTVAIPTVSGSFTYNGASHNATIGNTTDSSYYTQGGTTSAINAGTYTVTFTLPNTTDYQWSNGQTAPQSGTWTIERAKLTIPTLNANPTFQGTSVSVSPTLNNYNSSLMTLSGDTSATSVKTNGTYTITISLTQTAKINYQWSGGGTEDIPLSWNVLPKNLSGATITLPQDSYVYDGNAKQPDPTVSI